MSGHQNIDPLPESVFVRIWRKVSWYLKSVLISSAKHPLTRGLEQGQQMEIVGKNGQSRRGTHLTGEQGQALLFEVGRIWTDRIALQTPFPECKDRCYNAFDRCKGCNGSDLRNLILSTFCSLHVLFSRYVLWSLCMYQSLCVLVTCIYCLECTQMYPNCFYLDVPNCTES